MKTKRLQLMQQRTVTPQYTETPNNITRNISKLKPGCDVALSCT